MNNDGLSLDWAKRNSLATAPPIVWVIMDAQHLKTRGRAECLSNNNAALMRTRLARRAAIPIAHAIAQEAGLGRGPRLKPGNVNFDAIGSGLAGDGSVPSREGAILERLLRRWDRVVLNTVFEGKLVNLDELQSNAISVHAPRLRRNLVDGGAAAEINSMDSASNFLAEAKA